MNTETPKAPLVLTNEAQAQEPPTAKDKAIAAGWLEPDAEWLEKHVAQPFQAIAIKHGRMCFSMAMQCGMLSASLGQIAGQMHAMGSGVQRVVGPALQVVQRISNDFSVRILLDQGLSQEAFKACQQEIEQMGALSMQPPTQSRIILAH